MKKKLTIILIIALISTKAFPQNCTTNTPWCKDGTSLFGGELLGGDNTSTNPLTIQTTGLPRITILGTNGNVGVGTITPANKLTVSGNADVTGSVGIGTAVSAFQLDVLSDINITAAVGYYMLAGTTILSSTTAGAAGNLIVGRNAGGAAPGTNDTYVGAFAGASANSVAVSGTSTMHNVFVGNNAGNANYASCNTFVGRWAGMANTGGTIPAGAFNTFIGHQSGVVNTTGFENTFVGNFSGWTNVTGFNNTMLGAQSGFNLSGGNNNTYIGISAGPSVSSTLSSTTALGSAAVPTNNNTMILGNNSITVGIGMSGIAPGPIRRLEINSNAADADPQLRVTYTPATAGSPSTTGVWTDFQTTSTGDLLIHPSSSGTDRRVGINTTTTPGNTLEINSAGSVTSAGGSSGLMFTDLNTTTPPLTPNPFGAATPCVLSVNSSGTVVLVKGGEGNITGCSGGISVVNMNYITKITAANEICNSAIWENSSADHNVGIGTILPQNYLHIHGGSNASYAQYSNNSSATSGGGVYTGGLWVGVETSGNGSINMLDNKPINFLNNSNSARMKIQSNGNIFVGNYTGQTAWSLLSQWSTGTTTSTYHQFVTTNTGNTSANVGFRIGVTYNSTTTATDGELRSAGANSSINFLTNTLPAMQILANGNVGIGDYSYPFTAARKLNVYDPTNPQLRLTSIPSGASPSWAEISCTASGDLYLHPMTSAGTVDRNVGIGTLAPSARLHIISPNNTVSSVTGCIIDLTNTSTASPGSSNPIGLYVTSDVARANIHEGVRSNVNGGSKCRAFTANVNNTNENSYTNATNIGFGAYVTDNPSTSYPSPANIGFLAETGPSTTSTATSVNYAFKSLYGSPGNYSPTTVRGLDITNYDAKICSGVTIDLRTESSTTGSTSGTQALGVYCSSQPGVATNLDNYAVEENISGHFNAGWGKNKNIGIEAFADFGGKTASTGVNKAVYGEATSHSSGGTRDTPKNYGGEFKAYYGNENIAVKGYAEAGVSNCTVNYGGSFYAWYGPGDNIAVRADAYPNGSGSSLNYGVYATNNVGTTCTSTTCITAAGFFNGALCSTVGSFIASDASLKTNVMDLTDAKSIIDQLHPKTFYYDTIQSHMNLASGLQIGLIAQELQQVLPQLTKVFANPAQRDSNGVIIYPQENFTGIRYEPLITLLIAGYKQQQQQIDSLINALSNQPKPANNGVDGQQQKTGAIEVELNNQNKIILNQNVENPFKENTTINYFIPDNATKVQMMFYDNSGTILKTVDIKEKGAGSILVYGSNLSSGIYSYSLLADGKLFETKKMVKIK